MKLGFLINSILMKVKKVWVFLYKTLQLSLYLQYVYLQSTAVLTYRPSSQEKLLSCSLQSIEVFSCSLLSEEETALSIIDPLMINIDLNANPLPDLNKSGSAGLLEASEIRQRNLLLEVCYHSY